jgi:hypothetical protein
MKKKLVTAILLILFLISVPSMASMISVKSESSSSASFADDKVVEENSIVKSLTRGSDLSSATSANNISEENPALDNVTLAFDKLTFQGEWLGFHMGPAPDTYPPPSPEHFQGIARSPRTGIPPILYVTRTGNKDNPDYYGSIMVVQMNSRPQDGERLRSNRLSKADETLDTEPPSNDKCIKNIPFSDYEHVGGIQMVGDILAVPLEDKVDNPALPEGKVVFYNCSEPTNPVKLTYELNTPSHKIGVVGITKLPDGYFLLVMSWGNSKDLDFYRSSKKSFFDADFNFTRVSSISEDYLNDLEANHFWEFGKNSPQSLNFVTQKDGKVFLIGSRNTYPLAPEPNGDDQMYLWEVVNFNATQKPNIIGVRGEVHKMLSCPGDLWTWTSGGLVVQKRIQGNFMASGGAYISPSGELLYYSTNHFNKGPDNTVKMAELRHIYVSRTGTCGPQFRENHLGGPYNVSEGSSLNLTGTAYVIEPWVMMFQHDHFKGISVMMDFPDQYLDNYNDFPELDGRLGECAPAKQGFNDAMTSFIWCGPPGSVLRIYDDDNYDPYGNAGYLECPGTGSVVLVHDVRNLPNGVSWLGTEISEPDFNDEATSARISWVPADQPYSWDLDNDDEFDDAYGPTATYIASDGPSTNIVRMKYRHSNSTQDFTTVETIVNVYNVPPTASITSIVQPNPYFILPLVHTLNFTGNFTDPGWEDTHESSWDFGDGTVTPGTLVEENEYPDSTGITQALHSYSKPGRYTVVLTVTDDDGGSVNATASVNVITAEDAARFVNDFIQNCSDADFKRNVNQRKNVLSQKFIGIIKLIEKGAYQGAIGRLANDIRARADGHVDGNPRNDWITTLEKQQAICLMIDDLVAYLYLLRS